jgi:hypothetical protein
MFCVSLSVKVFHYFLKIYSLAFLFFLMLLRIVLNFIFKVFIATVANPGVHTQVYVVIIGAVLLFREAV